MIIDLVLPESRLAHASSLMQMHQDRKRVFVDTLGWELPGRGGWLEVDEFDNDFAVYLLARSATTGHHEGSVRLLPSTRPHMLASLFETLCDGPVPRSEDCWEISRLVTAAPAVAGTSILRLHRVLALALLEFAHLNLIKRYTLVTEPHRLPALLSVGWTVRPLGLPQPAQGQLLQALEIAVETRTITELRTKLHVATTLLGRSTVERRAA